MAANRIQVPAQAPAQAAGVDGDRQWALSEAERSGRVATAVGRPDREAQDFRGLYDTWFADVARWVRALGAAPADQDDLVQEVFVVVHRRLHAFDGENMAGWLYRIAAHQVRDFRRLRWIRHIFGRSVPLSPGVPSTGPTPLMMLETKEKQLEDVAAHVRKAKERIEAVIREIPDNRRLERYARFRRGDYRYFVVSLEVQEVVTSVLKSALDKLLADWIAYKIDRENDRGASILKFPLTDIKAHPNLKDGPQPLNLGQ
jgi:DNA-directed RNA polymerase specialized sigma24 family protein